MTKPVCTVPDHVLVAGGTGPLPHPPVQVSLTALADTEDFGRRFINSL